MSLLEGRTAIVSGVGPGMGRDIALALAEHGADVLLGARTIAKCEAVAEEVEALGRRAVPVSLDITDPESCEAAVATCLDELGSVGVLVNNAYHGGTNTMFADDDLDRWRKTFEVNTFGTLCMTQAVVPAMKAAGEGRIVMVNTMSTVRIVEKYGAYAASKAALATATKTLAVELGPYGIRVNGIHPGYIWGAPVEFYVNYLAEERGITPEEAYAELASDTCLEYLPHSSEIAGSVVFFASDLSKPVTGQALHVNAGHFLP